MNEKGSRYALSALTKKRATLAGEIVQLERQIRHRRESLVHVDACIKLLDPAYPVDDIPNKRVPKHINPFRQGELGRLILGALREAEGKPLRTPEIVAAIMTEGGIDGEARNVLRVRVRSNLGYLERRKKVIKMGERQAAKWL